MKYKIYAIKDKLVGFGVPHININDEVEMRDFKNAMSQDMNAGDKELHIVGEWDTETGTIFPHCTNPNDLTTICTEKIMEGKPNGENKK